MPVESQPPAPQGVERPDSEGVWGRNSVPTKLPEPIDDVFQARENALRATRDAAAGGDEVAGMLANLENLAQPFYLGLDCDQDDSDLQVWP